MKAFWDLDRGGRNFGDALGRAILERLAGIALEWSPPEQAEIFGVGSLAEAIPPGFEGWVFGTGKMFGSTQLDLRRARVIALRGALTAEGSRANVDLLADPGILAPYLLEDIGRAMRREHDVGTIRHYVDHRKAEGLVIDVLAPVDEVIAAAATCSRIVSSSLHGLVLADALHIPSMWMPHWRVLGEGFKFRDYASSYGETIRPGVWRQAPSELVTAKRAALMDRLADLRAAAAPDSAPHPRMARHLHPDDRRLE